MRRILLTSAFLCFANFAHAADIPVLEVKLGGIENGGAIPAKYAFCQPDAAAHTKDGGNFSPEISWSKGPEGTKSYAIIMVDHDVPASFTDANKEGKTIAEDFPRKDFYHWVLVDIPAEATRLPEGADSNGVDKKGKPLRKTSYGQRGVNSFGQHMGGTFAGYDGPCPPWNDARLHRYHFEVYALSAASLDLRTPFDAKQARAAMKGKVLAQGEVVGIYTQNPALANGK